MHVSFKRGLLYLFLLFFLGFPLYWFVFMLPVGPTMRFVDQLPAMITTEFVNQVPADLVVTVQQGKLEVNKQLPYCLEIQLPNSTKASQDVSSIPLGILFVEEVDAEVLGTLRTPNTSYRNMCNPSFAFTRDSIITRDSQKHSLEVQPLPPQLTLTATKDILVELVKTGAPKILSWIRAGYFMVPFLIGTIMFLLLAVLNYWYAGFSWVVFKLLSKLGKATVFPYRHYLAASLYSQVAWQIIMVVVNAILLERVLQSPARLDFPFLGSAMVTFFNWLLLRNQPLTPPPDSQANEDTPASIH